MSTPAAAYDSPSPLMGGAVGGPAERFGDQVVRLLGAAEHRSERIRACVSEEHRTQRRRRAAWAPKIRLASLAAPPPRSWLAEAKEARGRDPTSPASQTAFCPSRAAAAPAPDRNRRSRRGRTPEPCRGRWRGSGRGSRDS